MNQLSFVLALKTRARGTPSREQYKNKVYIFLIGLKRYPLWNKWILPESCAILIRWGRLARTAAPQSWTSERGKRLEAIHSCSANYTGSFRIWFNQYMESIVRMPCHVLSGLPRIVSKWKFPKVLALLSLIIRTKSSVNGCASLSFQKS